jgi:hypothetical protein
LNRQVSELAEKSSQPAALATNPYDNINGWPSFEEKPNVSLAYAFFAVIGGFVDDVSSYCDYTDHLTLGIDTVTRMARCGRYLPISEANIKDRNKADVLGKSLVCLQITWMPVQCSARKASGYPLTLLEIHPFVSAVCAVALYAFWFKVS